MEQSIKREILKNRQIKKFSLYGFLKDLKFFEPYLLIYLMGNGLSLLQIGILFAIREIIINIFEIPSGIIADCFGRKKELCICFIFYIISFFFFFLSSTFFIAVFAMVFFGLGEAFRSGTHKAMIYSYLEEMQWTSYKSFVYGKTRSLSLIGTALSSILAIFIILNIPSSKYIFLFATVPYILDFFLIMSYPKSIDMAENSKKFNIRTMLKLVKTDLINKKDLRKILIGNGLFESVVESIKDFIQPMLEMIIVGAGLVFFVNITPDKNLKIILGVVYAVINIFSSFASRNAYRLKRIGNASFLMNGFYISLSVSLLLLGLLFNNSIGICVIFLLIYLIENFRQPIFMEEIDSNMHKNERATMLSIAEQLKSLFIIILAPTAGWIADTYGMRQVMIALAIMLIVTFPLFMLKQKPKEE